MFVLWFLLSSTVAAQTEELKKEIAGSNSKEQLRLLKEYIINNISPVTWQLDDIHFTLLERLSHQYNDGEGQLVHIFAKCYQVNKQHQVDCYENGKRLALELKNWDFFVEFHSGLFNSYYLSRNLDLAKAEFDQHPSAIEKASNHQIRYNYYSRSGLLFQALGQYHLALEAHKKGLQASIDSGRRLIQLRSYGNLGVVYQNLGKYETSQQFFYQGVEIAEELQLLDYKEMILNNIAIALTRLEQHDKALDVLFEAERLFIASDTNDYLAHIYNNIAESYLRLGKFKQSLEYNLKSLEKEKLSKNVSGIATSLNNIGVIYQRLKKYDLAEKNIMAAKEKNNEIGNKRGLVDANYDLASLYFDLQKTKKALKLVNISINDAHELKMQYEELKGYELKTKILEQMQLPNLALKAFRHFYELQQTVFSQENKKIIANLEAEFNHAQQTKQIELLEKQRAISQLESDKKDANNRLLLIIILVSIISLIVLYSRYATGKKVTRIIHDKNEKLEVAYKDLESNAIKLATILNNLNQGTISVIDRHGHIDPSSHIKNISSLIECKSLENITLTDLILHHTSLSKEQISQIETVIHASIGEDVLNFVVNEELLPTESLLKERIIELDFVPVVESETIQQIIVVVRDVSDLRKFQEQAATDQLHMEMVYEILKTGAKKSSVTLESLKKELIKYHALDCPDKGSERFNNLFIALHTYKGNLRTLGFGKLTERIHAMETALDEKDDQYEEVAASLLNLIDEYLSIINDHFSEFRNDVRLVDFSNQFREIFASHQTDQEKLRELQECHQLSRSIRLADIVNPIISSLHSIANVLHKKTPQVEIQPESTFACVYFDESNLQSVETIFTQLMRNSIAHGFHSNEAGTIHCRFERHQENWKIFYQDSGRGLNLKKLSKDPNSALTDEQIAMRIFDSGVSTTDNADSISGRGVGMGAIKQEVRQLGGDLQIKWRDLATSDGFRKFQFEIVLPSSVFHQLERTHHRAS